MGKLIFKTISIGKCRESLLLRNISHLILVLLCKLVWLGYIIDFRITFKKGNINYALHKKNGKKGFTDNITNHTPS